MNLHLNCDEWERFDDRRLLDVPDLLDLLDRVETGRLVLDEREVR